MRRPINVPGDVGESGRASAYVSTRKTTTSAATVTPSRKSSGATWPPSFCRRRRSNWATSSGSPSSIRPIEGTIRDGYNTLAELGALDENGRMTELGRTLSRLPVDPRIGRMILAADEERLPRRRLDYRRRARGS